MFAVVGGVVLAHNALQVGELQHHFGDQIGLGQHGSTLGQGRVAVDGFGNLFGQGCYPYRFVVDAAQLVLEHDGLECLDAVFQPGLAVGVVEEGGVGQARANHFLVTGNHLGRVFTLQVGHGDKQRQHLPAGIHYVEVLLMLLHGGNQGFGRYIQEALLEAPHQWYRPFVQGSHFVQQVFVDYGLAAGFFLRQRGHAGADLLTTLGEVCQYVAFLLEHHFVVGRGGHNQLFRAVEPVATGLVAGLEVHHRCFNHLVAVQQNQPVYRAHEFRLPGTPAHAFGNGQGGQGFVHQIRHQFYGGLALLNGTVHQPGTLVGLHGVELIRGNPQGGGEAGQRPGGVTGIIKRCFHGRAALLDRFVRLGIGQVPDTYRQTTGCCEAFHRTKGYAGFFQAFDNALGESVREGLESFRRQLLGAQFDQKILSCHDYAFPCSCGALLAFLPFLLALASAASAAASTSLRRCSGASGKPSLRRLSK